MKIQLLNDLEDIGWLLTTHLRNHHPPAFSSFLITGNKDCPDKIDLFKTTNPTISSKPIAVYISDKNGDLILDLPTEW